MNDSRTNGNVHYLKLKEQTPAGFMSCQVVSSSHPDDSAQNIVQSTELNWILIQQPEHIHRTSLLIKSGSYSLPLAPHTHNAPVVSDLLQTSTMRVLKKTAFLCHSGE